MRYPEFVGNLHRLGRPAFTGADAARVLGVARTSTAVTLHRWVRAGRIRRVARGHFALADADPLVVASSLAVPGYVSFLAGLAHHGRTTQLPRDIDLVASRRRPVAHFGGTRIRTVVLRPGRLIGYRQELLRGGVVMIGDPEKIIVDCLLLPRVCPLGPVAEAFGHPVDIERLVRYAAVAGSSACRKRIGYLADLAGLDIRDRLQEAGLLPSYEPLNPLLPRRGERDPRWKLIVNDQVGPLAG